MGDLVVGGEGLADGGQGGGGGGGPQEGGERGRRRMPWRAVAPVLALVRRPSAEKSGVTDSATRALTEETTARRG
ncbi:hypothetical protein ACGFWF_08450 [Streptomyces sp. NPDC048581]|uniref:hypothetical protein n=1 Tax=Streptomyces sp. NPDC048581 TaxID=3365572 RepID=UPI0037212C80